MKELKVTLIFIYIISMNLKAVYAQSALDPYRNYFTDRLQNNPKINNHPVYPYWENLSPLQNIIYSTYDIKTDDLLYFTGEYEITLNDFFWHASADVYNTNTFPWTLVNINNSNGDMYNDYYNDFKIELVSFPFTNDYCVNNGCANCDSTTRDMYMPADPFINDKWGNFLYRETGTGEIPYGPSVGVFHISSSIDWHCTLASNFFTSTNGASGSQRYFLPHSILKFTINHHCGVNASDPIIQTFSFVYDNTRGPIRKFPFRNDNCQTNSSEHDLVLRPSLVIDTAYYQGILSPLTFDETASNGIWTNGASGTAYNFRLSDFSSSPNCSIPSASDISFNIGGLLDWENTIYPPPMGLLNTIMYNNPKGGELAGYKPDPNASWGSPEMADRDGIPINFHIDRNIDLTLINNADKIIYNPSEVYFTAGHAENFHFPSYYTFKTVLGLHPSLAQVNDANTAANGGPFSDLREVPVPVNAGDFVASSGNPLDNVDVSWDDPTTSILDERYGYYYLQNLSELAIDPCVRILDAKFEVNQSATLIFNDYPSTLNPARFFIKSSGGAIAKNLSTHQYLQNTIITQPQLITYSATQQIHAGTNVDPDPNAVDLPYTIEAGGNIEFVAQDYIRLSDGFSAKQGCAFHAHIAPVPSSSSGSCPSWATSNGSTRLAGKNTIANQQVLTSITATPNPNSGHVSLMQNNLPIKANGLKITDTYGRTVYEKENYNSATDAIDLSRQPSGLYMARCTVNGRAEMVKVVVTR